MGEEGGRSARRRPRHDARDRVQDDIYDERGVDREVDPGVRVRHDPAVRRRQDHEEGKCMMRWRVRLTRASTTRRRWENLGFMPCRRFQCLGGTGSS